jgi:hypothetical protein
MTGAHSSAINHTLTAPRSRPGGGEMIGPPAAERTFLPCALAVVEVWFPGSSWRGPDISGAPTLS